MALTIYGKNGAIAQLSSTGLIQSVIHGVKVFFWVVGSAVVAAGVTAAIQYFHSLGINHPEWITYVGVIIGALNAVGASVTRWLKTVDPTKIPQGQDSTEPVAV